MAKLESNLRYILKADEIKILLFLVLGLSFVSIFTMLCYNCNPFLYNFVTLLLLISAYLLSCIIIFWERHS
ncbi:hypothetical protein DRN74_03450 [Candidatus Micrarchaeota archaeon]|nr:MAG: hypothetical protein DRN74_03450 [Candidatus Micrarchaeota archaeon]